MSGREEDDMDAVHSTYAAGTPETLAAIVGGYRCGHCTGGIVGVDTFRP